MTQEEQISNQDEVSEFSRLLPGRLLALDPGTKRIGVAVSDETRTVVRPLERIERTSWKKVLNAVKELAEEYDARALVIGLPLNFDGTESEMTIEARNMAEKFRLSLSVPVFYQDERVTSYEARGRLWAAGKDIDESRGSVDSEAAAIILSDFLDRLTAA